MPRSLQNTNLFLTGDKFKLSYPRNIQIHQRILLCGFEIITILPNSWQTDFKKVSKIMPIDLNIKGKFIFHFKKMWFQKQINNFKFFRRKKMKMNIVQIINGIRIMPSKMILILMILKMKFSVMPKTILHILLCSYMRHLPKKFWFQRKFLAFHLCLMLEGYLDCSWDSVLLVLLKFYIMESR